MRSRIRFYADVLDRLRAVPGVSAPAGVAYVGMGLEPRTPRDYSIEGRPEARAGERPQAEFHAVTEDYFKTLEIRLLAGRDFARTDTPDSRQVIVLAAVGIFSVLAYLVGQRTRELAVRRALGAGAADVMRFIIGQGLRLVAIGLVMGLAGALAVARLLTGLLFEIGPWDIHTYLGTVIVLGGAALLATLLPAIRAATIAPVAVLMPCHLRHHSASMPKTFRQRHE